MQENTQVHGGRASLRGMVLLPGSAAGAVLLFASFVCGCKTDYHYAPSARPLPPFMHDLAAEDAAAGRIPPLPAPAPLPEEVENEVQPERQSVDDGAKNVGRPVETTRSGGDTGTRGGRAWQASGTAATDRSPHPETEPNPAEKQLFASSFVVPTLVDSTERFRAGRTVVSDNRWGETTGVWRTAERRESPEEQNQVGGNGHRGTFGSMDPSYGALDVSQVGGNRHAVHAASSPDEPATWLSVVNQQNEIEPQRDAGPPAEAVPPRDAPPAYDPLGEDEPAEVRRQRLREMLRDRPAEETAPAAELQPTVTLNQAVAEALANNPAIQATAEDIREAAAEWVTEALLPNPTLNAIGSMIPFPGRRFTPEREGGPPQLDVFVSYPIDWWLFGKRLAAMEAAQRGIEVAGAETADLIREQIAETIGAYFDVLEARALVNLAQLDVENLERVEELTRRLVELDAVGRIELERIRLEVLASRRELRETRVAYMTVKARLRSLMGRAGIERQFELAGDLEVMHPVLPLDEETAFELALEYRPDLAARQRDLQRASAEIRMEQVNAKPDVNLEAGYIKQYQRRVLEMPDAHSWGIGLEMTLPIHDRNQGNIVRAQANYRRAQWEYRAAVLEVRAEIETAVEAFRQAYAIITTEAPAQFEAARRVREAFERAYETGDRSFLEILDAQRTFRETMRLYIAGQAGYWRALYELNATVGQRVLD